MTLPSPYYSEDGITIYCGDCREIMPEVEAEAVVTDPPYGFRKAEWDDEAPMWWLELAAACAPRLGVMPGIWNLPEWPRVIGRLEYRWTLAAHLTNGMTRSMIGFGNWIPCLVYSAENRDVWRHQGDCRSFAVGTEDKPEHPTPKPLRVMKWIVERIGGESVLDPFMGSGTTLVAAKQLGRKAIGIEIEERYCEVAVQRLAQGVLPLEAS